MTYNNSITEKSCSRFALAIGKLIKLEKLSLSFEYCSMG